MLCGGSTECAAMSSADTPLQMALVCCVPMFRLWRLVWARPSPVKTCSGAKSAAALHSVTGFWAAMQPSTAEE